MLKVLAYAKLSLKSIIKELPTFIIGFAIFPIFMGLLMGFAQKNMFTPVIDEPLFSISVVDEDNSFESAILMDFLQSKEVSQIFTVDLDDTTKYTLHIPQGYGSSLIGESEAVVRVELEESAWLSTGNILASIVDTFNTKISRNLVIEQKMDSLQLANSATGLSEDLKRTLNDVYLSEALHTNIHEVKKNFTSMEYYSIRYLSFTFTLLLLAMINAGDLQKKMGIVDRVGSTPMTKITGLNGSFLSGYLQVLVCLILYIGTYKISGLSFVGSTPLLVLIILTQSLFITAVSMVFLTFFSKQFATILVNSFLYYSLVFGGLVGPLDEWTNMAIFKVLGKIKIDYLITEPYRNYVLYNSFNSVSKLLFLILIISLVLYLMTVMAVKLGVGENR